MEHSEIQGHFLSPWVKINKNDYSFDQEGNNFTEKSQNVDFSRSSTESLFSIVFHITLQTYKSLMGSLVIPYSIACLNIAIDDILFECGPIPKTFLTIICLPVMPFVLIIVEAYTKLKLQFCKKDEIEQLSDKYQKIKEGTCCFIRTELGCETTIQSFLGLLLLFFSMSSTKISETLALFDDTKNREQSETLEEHGYYLSPDTFLVLANIWSLFSGWRSFIRGMKASKDRFPFVSQLVLAGHVVLSMITKVAACLLFLTPCLGLFDCHRHFQGLLMPYDIVELSSNDPETYGKLNVSTDYVSYSNLTFPWAQLTPYDYSNPSSPQKPEITMFTVFDQEQILPCLWILFVIQVFLIMASKRLTNPEQFRRLNLLKSLTHCFENVWIPGPLRDWDHGQSTLDEYKQKRTRIDIEIGMTICLNLLMNVLMLVPLQIFAYNVNKRHQFLVDTIEPLPEEIDAHWKINFLSTYMIVIFMGAAFVQYIFYVLYNRVFHPFQDLMTDPGMKNFHFRYSNVYFQMEA